MVLDLSNSDKYYDPQEFHQRNVRWVKVRPGATAKPIAGSVTGFVYWNV
jgi:hypothetical protein